MRRFLRSVLPAFLLAVSVGQIYAFTNFSDAIAAHISTAAILVSARLGLGYSGVVAMLVALCVANLFNALSLRGIQSARP